MQEVLIKVGLWYYISEHGGLDYEI